MSENVENLIAELPLEARAGLNGQLDGHVVLAWAQHDLDEHNQLASGWVILTETSVIVQEKSGPRAIALQDISEVLTFEGLGVDRLNIIGSDRLLASLRYSRRARRDMTRLQRKIQRRLPGKVSEISNERADWLDRVERETERADTCPKCKNLIPAYADGVCPRCMQKRKILWRLLDVARPYRPQLLMALVMTLVVALMAVLPPIFYQHLIDHALEPRIYDAVQHKMVDLPMTRDQRLHSLIVWVAALLVTIIVSEWIGGWRIRILARAGTNVTRDLRHMVYAHLHTLSMRYFAKHRTGSLITRVTSDTDRLWDFIAFGSINVVRDVTMIIFIAAYMFYANWELAALALLPLPFLAVMTYYRAMKMQAMFGRMWTYWSRLTAVVGDAIPGVKVIKAFSNEKREIGRFERRSDEYTAKEQEIHIVWTALQPIVSGLMQFGTVMVWVVGGYIIITRAGSQVTLGVLTAFMSFVARFYAPIMELANSNRMITRAASSAQRVFEVLDTPPEIYSRKGSVRQESLQGSIEFKQVSFSYEGAQPALREVSLKIEPGEMIGLCGPSGAGKSTFVNLVSRFYDVTDGQLLIDAVDIRDYDVHWLRRQTGLVLQEPYLFHGTVADNVRYGNPDASPEEVIAAARAANAHDFIVAFPDGYDTLVGERGQSLSGGERQRISIARAILHNPRILILDEATSSVDSETEQKIQQALRNLVQGRTTIAIAHRLSTLMAADRLIVLDKGKVVEQGTHEELFEKEGGVYAKLLKTQLEMNSMRAFA